jgi:NAD(P)-dependent dehydrogenase (short-subunit alcohol dehydrogenase family)
MGGSGAVTGRATIAPDAHSGTKWQDTGMLTRFTGTAENKAALVKQVPLDRLGLSEEVADGIVFIASDAAKWITGEVLNVDGGMTAN